MKVLIVGSGGREHAIADAIARSNRVSKVFVTPGNAGMAGVASLIGSQNFKDIYNIVLDKHIDFVVIGPEQPLQDGLADYLEERGVAAIGPYQCAARIETSKAFAKDLMKRYNIPTADYRIFTEFQEALTYVYQTDLPLVIKADGLAAGKGVIIAEDRETAVAALNRIMLDKDFGAAGNSVVIEEYLTGYEGSIFAFTDGRDYKMTIVSHDYKKVFDDDRGPNTGGMGAYAPVKVSDAIMKEIAVRVFDPLLDGLKRESIEYRGIIYAGLIFTERGIKVLEFNARLGDPETQAVLPLMETDFVDVCEAIACCKVADLELKWKRGAAVSVVAASHGYPGKYDSGKLISIDNSIYDDENLKLYFANVIRDAEMGTFSSGGRVLSLTAIAPTLSEAHDKAYQNVKKIGFENIYYRTDIGKIEHNI